MEVRILKTSQNTLNQLNEYIDIKACVTHYKTIPIYDAYLLVSETPSPKFTHLLKVIKLMLSRSCSSAKCEFFFKHEIITE